MSKKWQIAVIGVATAVVGGGALGPLPAAVAQHSGSPAHHRPGHDRPLPVRPGSGYLALGDSVPFGYREAANPPPPVYTNAASFVGYPEDIGADLALKTVNASCPGETSASLIDATAPSNGCETAAGGTGPGYRTAFPLHVAYRGSQLRFAVHYLQRHRHMRLVSLMVGANDGFLCQETTADNCASELPSVLARVGSNIATILGQIRRTAHYHGQIVIVNYYSLDYANADSTAQSQTLNQAIATAAAPFHVRIADGFAMFQAAAAQAAGNSCTAGLLTRLTTGGCGVHPSVAGQQLLASAVERVVRKA